MFSVPDIEASRYSEAPKRTFDDVKDQSKILDIIKENPKRAIDNLILPQDS